MQFQDPEARHSTVGNSPRSSQKPNNGPGVPAFYPVTIAEQPQAEAVAGSDNGPFQPPAPSDLQAHSQDAHWPQPGSGSCHKISLRSSSMPLTFQNAWHLLDTAPLPSLPSSKGSPDPLGTCPTNTSNVSSHLHHPKVRQRVRGSPLPGRGSRRPTAEPFFLALHIPSHSFSLSQPKLHLALL